MGEPANSLYQMRIRVRSGPGCGMRPHAGSSSSSDPLLPDAESQRHIELFEQACQLMEGLVFSEDRPFHPPNSSEQRRLRKAVQNFQQVLALHPTNWQAMMLMGKAF